MDDRGRLCGHISHAPEGPKVLLAASDGSNPMVED